MKKWIAEFELEDGDTMPEHMDLEYKGVKLDFHCRPLEQEPTTKNDLGVDTDKLISDCEKMSFDIEIFNKSLKVVALDAVKNIVNELPSVTPQEPRCKECKWWKDSDGEYRRGCGAESQCPINRREVFEGNGYCYMFEPQKSEE